MSLGSIVGSTTGRKFINALTGIGLVVFIIVHLAGNLTLFSSNPELFNGYAKKLHDFGWLLYAAEIGLLLLFLFHIVSAIRVTLENRKGRSDGYRVKTRAGSPSRRSFSSETMIVSGLILMAFVIWHVISFRFGPGIADGYVTQLDGERARDLHQLVYEFFTSPVNVVLYVAVMIFLGFHLRHGFWSALQTLGLNSTENSATVYSVGLALAIIFALGFLLIPIWIFYFANGGL